MKTLVYGIVFTVAILSGCKYGSYHEARTACDKWSREGGTYTVRFVETEYSWKDFTQSEVPREEKESIRNCEEEKLTNQILGFEKKTITEGAVVERDYGKNYGAEVTKRFKY
jgi:hypothetical protein